MIWSTVVLVVSTIMQPHVYEWNLRYGGRNGKQ